ncbi:MAG: type III secretion system translocon subunit SctB [Victivallales bacterium]|nr:type III secretion system translocon subunit SctB [Victivallales bacterium]
MAGIEGIGNKGIDWKVMLESVTQTGNVNGADKTSSRNNLVLSEADKKVLLNLLGTPEIDAPKGQVEDPAAKLESLIDKLKNDKTFNFTEEQTKVFINTLETLLQGVNAAKQNNTTSTSNGGKADGNSGKADGVNGNTVSAGAKTSASQVLFDLYALMALLAECAQEQKNAQRQIRQAETTSIMTSIQNQADLQKSAALTGLIAGSIICAIQAGAAAYASYKTISNMKVESNISQETGVKGAASELKAANTELQNKIDSLKEFETEHPKPENLAHLNEEQRQIETQRTEKLDAVNQAKLNVAAKSQQVKLTRTVMGQSDEFMALKRSEAWVKGFGDVSMALGNLGQTVVRGFVEIQQAEATSAGAKQKKEENELDETKELMSSFQDLMDQVLQLAQAIQQAENQSMQTAIQA